MSLEPEPDELPEFDMSLEPDAPLEPDMPLEPELLEPELPSLEPPVLSELDMPLEEPPVVPLPEAPEESEPALMPPEEPPAVSDVDPAPLDCATATLETRPNNNALNNFPFMVRVISCSSIGKD
ncbi:MAG: hypothetical protein ACTHL1_00965 [Burkholderiaceae bacterium]